MAPDRGDKTPVEQVVEHAFDLFVYAPIGILFEGASLFPELVAKGKSHVALARMMGKYAVDQAQKRATDAAEKLKVPDAPAPRPTRAKPTPTATGAGRERAPAPGDGIDPASLAIPDYDGLSASQVVNRLAGLAPSELVRVRDYEAAHRGRKTILSKVAQLQGA
jgi:hypothetical protein